MKEIYCGLAVLLVLSLSTTVMAQPNSARNPVIWADIPDMSMIRVGDTYYMSSTTMHMAPGVPIMRSEDLINWEIVNYAYNTLGDNDALNLSNGKNAYGRGSWASVFVIIMKPYVSIFVNKQNIYLVNKGY
jgi:beta-xylosidase